MKKNNRAKKILIIDFGSQYTQLIARRVRELGVFSEISNHKQVKKVDVEELFGIILSGGPLNVYEDKKINFNKKILNLKVPILGLCFGHQLISRHYGGKVITAKNREFGLATIKKKLNSKLTKNFFDNRKQRNVWMSHADHVTRLPKGFKAAASTKGSKFTIIENDLIKRYGVQFHPEVTHTEKGILLLKNFVFGICKSKKNWSTDHQKKTLIKNVQNQIGNKKIICALSGGVDSSVVAQLLNKAVGKQLHCIFVNTGLLRLNEEKQVVNTFKKKLKMNLIYV